MKKTFKIKINNHYKYRNKTMYKLYVEVIEDEIDNTKKYEKDTIISTEPAAGTLLKEGDTIKLHIPDKSINYYRIGFYDNILNSDKLSMYIEIGYGKDAIISKEEVDKQLRLTIENLNKQGIIDESFELIDYETIIMDPAYVHISKDTDKEISQWKMQIANNNIYSIGRYGSWTYCSMEDCMIEAKKLLK